MIFIEKISIQKKFIFFITFILLMVFMLLLLHKP